MGQLNFHGQVYLVIDLGVVLLPSRQWWLLISGIGNYAVAHLPHISASFLLLLLIYQKKFRLGSVMQY